MLIFFLKKFSHNYLFISQLLLLLPILVPNMGQGNISNSFASLFVDGREPAVSCPLKRLTFNSSILKAKKLQLTLFYWVNLEHKYSAKE